MSSLSIGFVGFRLLAFALPLPFAAGDEAGALVELSPWRSPSRSAVPDAWAVSGPWVVPVGLAEPP